jgi:hypothetical protein
MEESRKTNRARLIIIEVVTHVYGRKEVGGKAEE